MSPIVLSEAECPSITRNPENGTRAPPFCLSDRPEAWASSFAISDSRRLSHSIQGDEDCAFDRWEVDSNYGYAALLIEGAETCNFFNSTQAISSRPWEPTTKVRNNSSRDHVMFEALKLPLASPRFYVPAPSNQRRNRETQESKSNSHSYEFQGKPSQHKGEGFGNRSGVWSVGFLPFKSLKLMNGEFWSQAWLVWRRLFSIPISSAREDPLSDAHNYILFGGAFIQKSSQTVNKALTVKTRYGKDGSLGARKEKG